MKAKLFVAKRTKLVFPERRIYRRGMTFERVRRVFKSGPMNFMAGSSVAAPAVGPQFVQGFFAQGNAATISNNPSNNYTFTPPEAIGAGNCLALIIHFSNAVTLTSLSDTVNGAWSTTPAQACAGTNYNTNIYLLPNSLAGQPKFTITFSDLVAGPPFAFFEISGIATSSPANGGAAGPHKNYNGTTPVSTGSFTPTTNNDANGGNFILAAFYLDVFAVTITPTSFVPSDALSVASFKLLRADIGWTDSSGQSKADCFAVQAVQAAINPAMTPTADTSANDFYNCVAIALKASPGAGTVPSGMRVVSQVFFDNTTAGGVFAWKNQFPTTGNLRVMTTFGGQYTGVTDSEGNTWSFVPNDAAPGSDISAQIWYFPNAVPNPNLIVTATTTAANNIPEARFYDIAGAATSNVLGAHAFTTTHAAGITQDHSPDITPTKAGSVVICAAPNGLGPETAMPNPANAVFDNVGMTGSSFTATISNGSGAAGTIMNVTAFNSGRIAVGGVLVGNNVLQGTSVLSFGTGNGTSTGTYNVNLSQLVSSEAMFTGEGDSDTYNTGNGWGHFKVTPAMVGVSQSVTWTVPNTQNLVSNAAEFKSP